MNMIRVWNKKSANYNANQFVKQNGTSSFEIESDDQVVRILHEAIRNKTIERINIDLEMGQISWVRSCQDECDEYDGGDECECDCDDCC